MFAPALTYLAHAAPVSRAVEQALDQQSAVVTGDQLGERITILDAVGR